MSRWETLDVAAMLKQETVGGATTSANAGAFAVPIGRPISRYPVGAGAQDVHKRRRHEGDGDPYGGGYQSFDDWMMPSKV